MGERRNLMIVLVAAALVLMGGALFLLTRGGTEEVAESLPAPSLAAPAAEDPAEEGVEVETGVEATRRGSSVVATSNRDPFAPVIEPSTEATADESSDAKTRSSSDPGDDSEKKSQSTDTKATSRNETKADADTQKEKVAKDVEDSGGKAPKPVGGSTVEDDTERAGTDVRVVDVRESIAVVRVNDSRTTLYVGVPDASGVTFSSALGGTCGLFSIAGSEELLTICEGETRQL